MKKSIVIYYTWSGRTKGMAATIASLTGADVLEILPATPYTQDYNAVVKQAKQEIRQGLRPPIRETGCDLRGYEVVYLGTPIWWGTMAPPLAAFMEGQDFSGKTVMPFSTHGGGGKGRSHQDIAALCPGATVLEMYTAYEGGGKNASKEIAAWIQRNGQGQ